MPSALHRTAGSLILRTVTITSLISFFSLFSFSQTISWAGGTSTEYFNKYNWSDTNINFALLTSTTLMIGPGNPNYCVHTGGNSSNVNYRSNRLNTLAGSTLIVNGKLYTNNSDSLNGNITLNAPADFNIRNIVYIGRSGAATVTMNGGALSSKNGMYIATGTGGTATVTVAGGSLNAGAGGANMDLNLANGAGLTATLNITGGKVSIARNLNIGSGGHIHITGIGVLQVAGDKTAQLNALVSDGRLTCAPGKTLSISYDGTYTTASIPPNPNSMVREYPDSVVLNNGILRVRLDKATGNIVSLKVNGVETMATSGNKKYAYYDFHTSFGFETMYGVTFSVVQDTTDIVEVSFSRPYTPTRGHVTPCDADIHYVLKKNDRGLYTYSVLEHQPSYPAFDLGSWRQVFWIGAKDANTHLCEKIYADSVKRWQMPSIYDYANASPTPIPEIIKLNTGVRAGKYDGKYQYSTPLWEAPAYGHASDINNIGTWCVFGSHEFFGEGPTFHDLNAAAGIIHVCMNGVHYNAAGINVPQGEHWRKIYGPYLWYFSDKTTGDANWADAKARAAAEKTQWPYTWLHHPEYPQAGERGAITGKFIINDPFKPAIKGQNAWVGVTQLTNPEGQWQFESKNYHYWVKTDAYGNFTIPNIRPGTYTFIGYTDGETGDYQLQNVVVTAGTTTDLGSATWNIPRTNGRMIFEVGVPNRNSSEFRLGDFDYSEGFVEKKFKATFPNPIEYNTAANNWDSALCYAHTPYPDTDSTRTAWKWRLHFLLPDTIPATGNAVLTIAYASSDHSNQYIYVNNENSLFTRFYPANGGGNAFIRQSNYAKYAISKVNIPFSRLKPGDNVITLVMASTQSMVNHVMYDYISLEAGIPEPHPVILATTRPVSCYGGTDGAYTIQFSKGIPPYEVKPGADSAYTPQTSPYTVSGLAAGLYTVYVKDAGNNTDSLVVTIEQPDSLHIRIEKRDVVHVPRTRGTRNGSISIMARDTSVHCHVKLGADGIYTPLRCVKQYHHLPAGSYTVYAMDTTGCEYEYPVTINVRTHGHHRDSIEVYPNPSDSRFWVRKPGHFRYAVLSLWGKVLEEGQATDMVEVGHALPRGIYLLKITANGEMYFRQLLKN